jgi:hypothetical protein
MTTVQIVGIVVAAIVVILLVVALIVTRRRGEHEDVHVQPPEEPTGSFLDAPVSDTLGKLGKAEGGPEEIAESPGAEGPEQLGAQVAEPPGAEVAERGGGADLPAEPSAPQAHPQAPEAASQALGLDWGTSGTADVEAAEEAPAAEPEPGETTEDLVAPVSEEAVPPAADTEEAGAPAEAVEEADVTAEAPTGDETAQAAHLVPLSAIIVTTSDKLVDLDDPEVRRMLTDLVTFEIDQATQYRQQGLPVDAVLQLTEAEKICNALGMHDTAARIRQMMADMNA